MIVPDKARRRLKILGHLLIKCIDFIAKIKESHEKVIRISKKISLRRAKLSRIYTKYYLYGGAYIYYLVFIWRARPSAELGHYIIIIYYIVYIWH